MAVGIVRSSQPARREVRLRPFQGQENALDGVQWVRLVVRRETDTSAVAGLRCRIEQVRHHSDELIVRFCAGVTRDTVAAMKGLSMVVDEETASPDEGAYHVAHLEGLMVHASDGAPVGIVTSVYMSGLNEAIEIETADGGSMLLPVIEQVIESVDLERGVIVIADVAPYVVEDAD